MPKLYINRYISYCNSLESLKEARKRDKSDSFVLSGTIQKFNLTFDLSWKVMKDILQKHYGINDYATGSPKENLRVAASCGLISDDIWIQMCNDRNDLIHDYDLKLANEKFEDIIGKYVDLFEEFKEKAEEFVSILE